MIKQDVITGVPYAVEQSGHAPLCVIALSTSQRVAHRPGNGNMPFFKLIETGRYGAGYPVVEIDTSVEGALARAHELTMVDFLSVTWAKTAPAPGLKFNFYPNFAKLVGPYDEVMAERKRKAEELERSRREQRQLRAEAITVHNALVRRTYECTGTTTKPWPEEFDGTFTRPNDVRLSFKDMEKLLTVAEAAKKLFRAVDWNLDHTEKVLGSTVKAAQEFEAEVLDIFIPF